MDCPVYIIGDLNISSKKLGDNHTNKFGRQFEVIHRLGKIHHEGPFFPTFVGTRSATNPDKIFRNNRAYFNVHSAPGSETISDHTITLTKVSCHPIQVPIKERKCLKKTDWGKFKEETGKIQT